MSSQVDPEEVLLLALSRKDVEHLAKLARINAIGPKCRDCTRIFDILNVARSNVPRIGAEERVKWSPDHTYDSAAYTFPPKETS